MEGSGGYWGLGKTTFFKMGIGLVIYYSKTKENGAYISKLAAALVEDESANPLVDEKNSRGISFFGQYAIADENNIRDVTIPITDEGYIRKFLDIFKIKPYLNSETGTTIIMPYVNFGTLLKDAKPSRIENISGRDPVWVSSVEDYIRIAVQRWYSPRLSNPEYEGSWLKASINGEPIPRDGMIPLFRLISELYNVSSNPNYTSDYLKNFDVKTAPIRCAAVKGFVAGNIGAVYTTVESLKLTNEYFRNAYSLIGEYEAALSSPIVTYTRKPGMLVRYVTKSSSWIPRMQNQEDGKILICVFKLASDRILKDNKTSLEEYIRARERADHNNWENETEFGIVDRIAENTASALKSLFNPTVKNELVTRSTLSKLFADIFLPPSNVNSDTMRNSPKRKTGDVKARKKSRTSKSKFEIESSSLEGNTRTIEFTLGAGAESDAIDFELVVCSERSSVNCAEWEMDLDKEFPLSIKKFTVKEITGLSGKAIEKNYEVNLSNTINIIGDYTVFTKKSIKGVTYGLKVDGKRAGFSLKGTISIECAQKSISFEVKNQSMRFD